MPEEADVTTPSGPPPTSGAWRATPAGRQNRRAGRILAVAITAAVILVAAVGSLVLWDASPHIGPSDFAPAGIERASSGSVGCRSTSGEVCYAATIEASLPRLTLAHLRFVVANASAGGNANGPLAPPLPLGPGAQVAALASPSSIAGVWNVSEEEWTSGGDWPVSSGSNVTVILDTGLVSNATLGDAEFDIVLTSPYEGGVGFPLFCGGC